MKIPQYKTWFKLTALSHLFFSMDGEDELGNTKMSWLFSSSKKENKILKSAIQSISDSPKYMSEYIWKRQKKKMKKLFRNERVAPAEKKLEQKVTAFTCRA